MTACDDALQVVTIKHCIFSSAFFGKTCTYVTGAEPAAQPEPFAREARFLSESKALGRDVRVMLEGVDKFNNLFGQVNASA